MSSLKYARNKKKREKNCEIVIDCKIKMKNESTCSYEKINLYSYQFLRCSYFCTQKKKKSFSLFAFFGFTFWSSRQNTHQKKEKGKEKNPWGFYR